MGGTTAIVLVVLIIAVMVIGAMVVLVYGAVRALEVRRNARANANAAPVSAPAVPPSGNTTLTNHPLFDPDNR